MARRWVVRHEHNDEVAAGPFDSYEEADEIFGRDDDVYVGWEED